MSITRFCRTSFSNANYHTPPLQTKTPAYLAEFPVLQALYVVKQKLIRFILLKTLTARRARKKLPHYINLLEQLQDSPLRALVKTLKSWMEPIVAMWRFSKSNGITEGLHNKMEMISRRAYGFLETLRIIG